MTIENIVAVSKFSKLELGLAGQKTPEISLATSDAYKNARRLAKSVGTVDE